MSKSAAERETIIRWSDDKDEALTVYTHRGSAMLKLKRMGASLLRTETIKGKPVSWTLTMPREWAKWPRKPRKVSPERAAAMAERLKAARAAR